MAAGVGERRAEIGAQQAAEQERQDVLAGREHDVAMQTQRLGSAEDIAARGVAGAESRTRLGIESTRLGEKHKLALTNLENRLATATTEQEVKDTIAEEERNYEREDFEYKRDATALAQQGDVDGVLAMAEERAAYRAKLDTLSVGHDIERGEWGRETERRDVGLTPEQTQERMDNWSIARGDLNADNKTDARDDDIRRLVAAINSGNYATDSEQMQAWMEELKRLNAVSTLVETTERRLANAAERSGPSAGTK
ncbi:MAG: hypothetical protein JRL30_17115 [Deltaproteobacteria bacterium]|nr:hypothetical protein [Deltaproteobacteria bacterium]